MLNDKRFLILIGVLVAALLANSFVLAQVFQHQQQQSLALTELQLQLSLAESQRLDLEQQILENKELMETKVSEQRQSMNDTLEQLDLLAEENDLLRKKLQ